MPTATIQKAVAIYQEHLELFLEVKDGRTDGLMDNS